MSGLRPVMIQYSAFTGYLYRAAVLNFTGKLRKSWGKNPKRTGFYHLSKRFGNKGGDYECSA